MLMALFESNIFLATYQQIKKAWARYHAAISGRTACGWIVLGKCLVLQIKPESGLAKFSKCNFGGSGISIDRLMKPRGKG